MTAHVIAATPLFFSFDELFCAFRFGAHRARTVLM